MTDGEKLINLIKGCNLDSMGEILNLYFLTYYEDYSAKQLHGFITDLNRCLGYKVKELDEARFVAHERATYLKKYLSGDMWLTEEAARANLQPQIDNAQAIIDACKSK